jgi:hypothetical protein
MDGRSSGGHSCIRGHQQQPALRQWQRVADRLMDTIYQTESSWPEWLSCAHLEFIADFVERAQASEQAVVDRFLASKEGG